MALSKHHSLVGNIMKTNDPYEILGVSRGGKKEEIDRCYKWTMAKVHPDKNSHPLATKAAQKVNVSRDLLLSRRTESEPNLRSQISEMYLNIHEELLRIVGNLKLLLILVSVMTVLWFFHLFKYVTANEWSVVQTRLHQVQRKTPLYRIRYFTLSEGSPLPAEIQVFQQYLRSMLESCRNHLRSDPWYGFFLYYPSEDLCTEGKITLIYFVIFLTSLTFAYSYFRRKLLSGAQRDGK